MLKNRTLPIVTLLTGVMMFGACAENAAAPSKSGITVEPAVEKDTNEARNLEIEPGEGAEVHSPDGEWTEPYPPRRPCAVTAVPETPMGHKPDRPSAPFLSPARRSR